MRCLIVYGTDQGHTRKIAHHIGRVIQERGNDVRLANARKLPEATALDQFDAVIVGGSLHTWKFQQEVVGFVRSHLPELQIKPSAFFGVSLSEADPDPGRHLQMTLSFDAFFQETGWQPAHHASFAGAIPENRFSWLMRLFWQRLERRRFDYTDWDAVTRFATEFADTAAARIKAEEAVIAG
jgi:menaquinone-dependent protoporphyrinogen oxidase